MVIVHNASPHPIHPTSVVTAGPSRFAMNEWFIRREDETEVGPLRPSELLGQVRSGEVTSETLLRKNDSAWFEASKVGGLFEAAARRPQRHHCPFCNHVIEPPPVHCRHCQMDVRKSVLRDIPEEEEQPDRSNTATKSIKGWLKKKRLKKT